jgi:hypothetical protein
MYVVFQTETGGSLVFPALTVPAAVSGYADVVAKDRTMYRFDGVLVSGNLYVSRSGLANNLPPDQYVVLPQLVDDQSRVYFLDTADVQIVEVPSFFEHVVLTPGNSVLVRLNNVESLLSLLLGAGFNPDGTIGIAPSGAAGGDLSGEYPNPDVTSLRGVAIRDTTPNVGDVLVYSGGEWSPLPYKTDSYYRHQQNIPSSTWVVDHNLDKRPAVSVQDTSGATLIGAVSYTNLDQLVITFTTSESGEAECN